MYQPTLRLAGRGDDVGRSPTCLAREMASCRVWTRRIFILETVGTLTNRRPAPIASGGPRPLETVRTSLGVPVWGSGVSQALPQECMC
jgi:hypothetical protein